MKGPDQGFGIIRTYLKAKKNAVWIYLPVTSLSNLSDKLPGCTVDQGVYNDITSFSLSGNLHVCHTNKWNIILTM